MKPNQRQVWYSRLPRGSLGLVLVIVAGCAVWAHDNAPKPIAWALTGAAAAAWVGAIVWCTQPLLDLQRDPVLRRMGLTPWRVGRGSAVRRQSRRGER